MPKTDWKSRLAAGIEASNKSQREISLAAGKGPGYVNSLLNEGKDPTISNLIDICKAANISIFYVLGGFDISPEKEEFLRLLDRSDDEIRNSVRLILGRGRRA